MKKVLVLMILVLFVVSAFSLGILNNVGVISIQDPLYNVLFVQQSMYQDYGSIVLNVNVAACYLNTAYTLSPNLYPDSPFSWIINVGVGITNAYYESSSNALNILFDFGTTNIPTYVNTNSTFVPVVGLSIILLNNDNYNIDFDTLFPIYMSYNAFGYPMFKFSMGMSIE